MRQRNGKTIQCKVCEKLFYVPLFRVHTAKYCSFKCQINRKIIHDLFNCLVCGKTIVGPKYFKRSKKQYCSKGCQETYRKQLREKLALFKTKRILKKGSGCRLGLKKLVFQNYGKHCQVCGYKQYDFCLVLHHIDDDPWNNELSNIAVVCLNCKKGLQKSVISLAIRN